MAHRDNLGTSPGANDNASGTAALLELARNIGTSSLAHTIVFVSTDGGAFGGVGAEHFAATPAICGRSSAATRRSRRRQPRRDRRRARPLRASCSPARRARLPPPRWSRPPAESIRAQTRRRARAAGRARAARRPRLPVHLYEQGPFVARGDPGGHDHHRGERPPAPDGDTIDVSTPSGSARSAGRRRRCSPRSTAPPRWRAAPSRTSRRLASRARLDDPVPPARAAPPVPRGDRRSLRALPAAARLAPARASEPREPPGRLAVGRRVFAFFSRRGLPPDGERAADRPRLRRSPATGRASPCSSSACCRARLARRAARLGASESVSAGRGAGRAPRRDARARRRRARRRGVEPVRAPLRPALAARVAVAAARSRTRPLPPARALRGGIRGPGAALRLLRVPLTTSASTRSGTCSRSSPWATCRSRSSSRCSSGARAASRWAPSPLGRYAPYPAPDERPARARSARPSADRAAFRSREPRGPRGRREPSGSGPWSLEREKRTVAPAASSPSPARRRRARRPRRRARSCGTPGPSSGRRSASPPSARSARARTNS